MSAATTRPCGDCRHADSWGVPLSRWCEIDCRHEPINLPVEVKQVPAPVAAVETFYIRADDLQKARRAPHFCRVDPAMREGGFVPVYTAAPAPAAQGEPVAFFDPARRTIRLNPLHSVQVAASAWRGEVPLHAAPAAKPQPSHGWVDEDIARTELQRAIEAEPKSKEY